MLYAAYNMQQINIIISLEIIYSVTIYKCIFKYITYLRVEARVKI